MPWILGVSIVTLAVFGPASVQLAWMAWKQRALSRQLRTLERTHQALVTEHDRLQHDPVYVEGLIRSTFKLAKPGELVIPLDSSDSSDR